VATPTSRATRDNWLEETGCPLAMDSGADIFGPLSTVSWTELIFTLEALLNALASDGGGFLVLNVDRQHDPFVQFVVDRLGPIETEAASTLVAHPETQERRCVDSVTERRLLRLGWSRPMSTRSDSRGLWNTPTSTECSHASAATPQRSSPNLESAPWLRHSRSRSHRSSERGAATYPEANSRLGHRGAFPERPDHL